MRSFPEQKRLTWDAAFPTPYESVWSILFKVIVFNNLTFGELSRLIRLREFDGHAARSLNCVATDWIDFDILSSLLGINVERLTQGTWRRLGILPTSRGQHGLRRCPECWKSGYHCVLFDVDVIETCPLHKCELTRCCRGCASLGTFILRTKLPLVNQRFCASCNLVLPSREALIGMKIPQEHARILSVCCGSITNWWRTIGIRFQDRDLLLSDIFSIGELLGQQVDHRRLQLDHAIKIGGSFDSSWKLKIIQSTSRYQTFTGNLDFKSQTKFCGPDRQNRIKDSGGKHYRSLRNNLYKRFIRPHRKCYLNLMHLRRHESMGLNGDSVCLIAFAFLIWRLSIEGVTQIEGLRRARRKNFELRLMGPRPFQQLPLYASLRWCYFSFFGILQRLEEYSGPISSNFRVSKTGDICEGYVHWKCAEQDFTEGCESPHNVFQRFAVLYPDPLEKIERNSINCQKRNLNGNMISMTTEPTTSIEWRGGRDDFCLRDCLFEVTFPNRGNRELRFNYIDV